MLVEELMTKRTWLTLTASWDHSGNGFFSASIHFIAFLKRVMGPSCNVSYTLVGDGKKFAVGFQIALHPREDS